MYNLKSSSFWAFTVALCLCGPDISYSIDISSVSAHLVGTQIGGANLNNDCTETGSGAKHCVARLSERFGTAVADAQPGAVSSLSITFSDTSCAWIANHATGQASHSDTITISTNIPALNGASATLGVTATVIPEFFKNDPRPLVGSALISVVNAQGSQPILIASSDGSVEHRTANIVIGQPFTFQISATTDGSSYSLDNSTSTPGCIYHGYNFTQMRMTVTGLNLTVATSNQITATASADSGHVYPVSANSGSPNPGPTTIPTQTPTSITNPIATLTPIPTATYTPTSTLSPTATPTNLPTRPSMRASLKKNGKLNILVSFSGSEMGTCQSRVRISTVKQGAPSVVSRPKSFQYSTIQFSGKISRPLFASKKSSHRVYLQAEVTCQNLNAAIVSEPLALQVPTAANKMTGMAAGRWLNNGASSVK